jgi:hypothetical protein
MTEIINYEGIDYTVADGETEEDLLKKPGFAEAHRSNMLKITKKLVAPTPEEKRLLDREANKSGVLDALLQGMSNDQGYQTAWLARKRFPNLVEQGIDPVDFYFVDEDEDIAYVDPYSGDIVKEFRDSLLVDSARFVGPTAQFAAELGAGALGLAAGAFGTGNPFGAAAGGAGGTYLGGGAAYAGRAGISAAFDGPPLKVSKLEDDLLMSAAFGAIPFGTKPMQLLGSSFRTASKKFPGKDGRTALETILKEGGESAQEKVAFAKERFGVDLTRAEAEGIITNAGAIQRYLQMQPGSQKLWDFYHNRQAQVEEAADEFFDEILRGKYLTAFKQGRLSGRQALDPDSDLAKAADAVLKKLAEKRKTRAQSVYKNAFELDLAIDVSDIAKQLQSELADPNLRGKARTVKQELLDALTDFSGLSKTQLVSQEGTIGVKDNTELLHNALRNDFRPLYEGLTKDNQATLRREVADIRSKISNRLKAANPEYKRATEIYDPTKGHLQALQSSVVTQLAEVAGLGGEQAARLTAQLFKGTVKPKGIRMLRRLIETEDPQVWQNLKGTWLRTQFDDAIASSVNPLGVNNRFLSRLGIRGKLQPGRGGAKARGTKAEVFRQMLSPEELENFVDLVELMQATSYIATQGGSPTQPLQALQKLLEKESGGLGRTGISVVRAAFEIPQRLVVRGFDDAAARAMGLQREFYEDKLIEALIDPTVAADLAKAIDAVKPATYFVTQAVSRGATDVLGDIAEDRFVPDQIDPVTGQLIRGVQGAEMIESAKEVTQPAPEETPPARRQRQRGNPQTMLEGLNIPDVGGDVNLFEPLSGTDTAPLTAAFDPSQSAIVLPRADDRELAGRLRGPLGGIASLAG